MFEFIQKEQAEHNEVSISGELTIYCAESLYASHIKDFSTEKNVLLNLEKVEEIDTSGIQNLLMLRKQCLVQGHQFSLGPSASCVENFLDLFNLRETLTSDH